MQTTTLRGLCRRLRVWVRRARKKERSCLRSLARVGKRPPETDHSPPYRATPYAMLLLRLRFTLHVCVRACLLLPGGVLCAVVCRCVCVSRPLALPHGTSPAAIHTHHHHTLILLIPELEACTVNPCIRARCFLLPRFLGGPFVVAVYKRVAVCVCVWARQTDPFLPIILTSHRTHTRTSRHASSPLASNDKPSL